MSADRATFAALDTRLATFTPACPIAYPNLNFTPPVTSEWLKVDYLPAGQVRRSIGVDGQNVYPGVYQVMVNWPANTGPGLCQTRADAIANWFPRGSVYGSVRVVSVSCGPALSDSEFYRIPVSVQYEVVTSA